MNETPKPSTVTRPAITVTEFQTMKTTLLRIMESDWSKNEDKIEAVRLMYEISLGSLVVHN